LFRRQKCPLKNGPRAEITLGRYREAVNVSDLPAIPIMQGI
jgi:hypothetical protein